MLLIFVDDRSIGRPTRDGKMCEGKLAPAKPHLTNCDRKQQFYRLKLNCVTYRFINFEITCFKIRLRIGKRISKKKKEKC